MCWQLIFSVGGDQFEGGGGYLGEKKLGVRNSCRLSENTIPGKRNNCYTTGGILLLFSPNLPEVSACVSFHVTRLLKMLFERNPSLMLNSDLLFAAQNYPPLAFRIKQHGRHP